MDFLSREGSPISKELWNKIDENVISMAKRVLVGRKFLHLYGPLGAGVQSINIDSTEVEETGESLNVIKGRKYVQIPLIQEDFSILWRDLETSEQTGFPVDLSAAAAAGAKIARKEDELIFLGNKKLGYEGLLTADGVEKVKKGDWSEGENPVMDISAGLAKFLEKGLVGRTALIVSTNLLLQLQRIQPGTGVTEYERLSKLVQGNIFSTPVIGSNKAILVNAEPQNMDLAVGQDIAASYLETKDLNHIFRVLETAVPRIKNKDAVIIFE